MGFVQAVKSGFVNAFRFSGRARRPEYWWFFLFVFAGAFVLMAVEWLLVGAQGPGRRGLLVPLFQIVVFIPFLAVGWRRLQDTGRPGWWLLIPSGIVVLSSLVAGSMMVNLMQGGMMRGQMMGGADPMAIGPAGGSFGVLLLLSLAQIVAGVVIVWWMTRPSQRGENAYGPEPRVR